MPWRLDVYNTQTRARLLTKVTERPVYQQELIQFYRESYAICSAIMTRLPNNVTPMAGRCYVCREAIQESNVVH